MVIIALKGRKWVLYLSPEDKKEKKEPICCHCLKKITIPFYICEISKKWYCSDCETNKKRIICKSNDQSNEHQHFLIKEVIEK